MELTSPAGFPDGSRNSQLHVDDSIPRQSREGGEELCLEERAMDAGADRCKRARGEGHAVAVAGILAEDGEESA